MRTKGLSIDALGMQNMSYRCHFDLGRFNTNMPAYPTFGDLAEQVHAEWRSDCLTNCSNAYDPGTYVQYTAPHVDMFREVVAYAVGTPDGWPDALEAKHGVSWMEQSRYNCDGEDNLPAVAARGWADKRPDMIMVGKILKRQGCSVPMADSLTAERH